MFAVIINTRGTGEIQGPSSGFRSMTATTLKNVPNGSTRNTVYPASFSQNSASGTADVGHRTSARSYAVLILVSDHQLHADDLGLLP
jgi:hypothetical protein